jgi:Na+/proline symporter
MISAFAQTARAALAVPAARITASAIASVAMAFARKPQHDIYNILWAVVFGFATLNILSLATRRMEPGRRGLTFGELLAVLTVLVSVLLLGWEMLNLMHLFPIKLRR